MDFALVREAFGAGANSLPLFAFAAGLPSVADFSGGSSVTVAKTLTRFKGSRVDSVAASDLSKCEVRK
jgi:hypothetical protein